MGEQPVMTRKIDEIDERLIWELRGNARISNNELAARAGVAPSTALVRVRALTESGVITSSHVHYDMAALGLELQAIVFVRLKPGAQSRIGDYASQVVKLANVVNIFYMGGNYDLLIHVACTSSTQLRLLVAKSLATHPDVATTQAHIVFEHLIGAQHMDHFDGFPVMRADLTEDSRADD